VVRILKMEVVRPIADLPGAIQELYRASLK
jgi:hypothetical protein